MCINSERSEQGLLKAFFQKKTFLHERYSLLHSEFALFCDFPRLPFKNVLDKVKDF